MKFLLDHDVPEDLTYLLQELGHEFLRLRDVLPQEATDALVLRVAYDQGCLLPPVTATTSSSLRRDRLITASLSSSDAGRVRQNVRRCFACWNAQMKQALRAISTSHERVRPMTSRRKIGATTAHWDQSSTAVIESFRLFSLTDLPCAVTLAQRVSSTLIGAFLETLSETLTVGLPRNRGRRWTPASKISEQTTRRMPADIRPVTLNLRVVGSIPTRLTRSRFARSAFAW